MDSSVLIAGYLLDAGAFKLSLNPLFVWTSGIKSPVYCDLRVLNSFVKERNAIIEALVDLVPEDTEVIAGTATAGISWGAWVADRLGKPFVYIRKEAKEHGAKKQIEGKIEAGRKVLLVEDLISTGGSCIHAVRALRQEAQAEVSHVISINTYKMAAAEEVAKSENISFLSVTNSECIFKVAMERGLISFEQEAMLQSFGADPKNWAAANSFS